MKQATDKLLLVLLTLSVTLLIICCMRVYNMPNPIDIKQQAVDLPEEYKELSHDSSHPDTVLAFYDNDTVYVEFKH
jgi:hypothetical protein